MIGEVVRTATGMYLRCASHSGTISGEQDLLDLLSDPGEMESNRLLLTEDHLHPNFFELRTGLAGAIFLKLSTYRVKTAIVANLARIESMRFHELVGECNRGDQINFFTDSAQAEEWLVA